jgi:NADH-quinone oxidoreductase subunit M
MPELHGPWLELSIFVPVIAAVIVGLLPKQSSRWRISSLASGGVLLISLLDWFDFASLHTFEAHDPSSMTESLFGSEIIVVDEFNAPLIALAAGLFFVVILATPTSKCGRFPFGLTLTSMSLLLCLLSCRSPVAIMTLLAAQNLLPLVELHSRKQAWQFFAVHQLLSMSLIVVGYYGFGSWSGDNPASTVGMLLTAAGILIRSGCIPFHCWIVDLFDRASLGTGLLFVTPMAGAYALVRLVLPIAPDWIFGWISWFSLFTAAYASAMLLVQVSARRFFAYLMIGNSSLLLVGLESLTPIGLTGALSLWMSIGIALMSLGVILRALEGRVGRVSLDRYHGLFRQMPMLAAFFLLALLASIGFPGTVGFVGVELLVECSVTSSPFFAVIILLVVTINAVAAMRFYFRIFTGSPAPATISMQPRPAELAVIWIFTAMIVLGGLFPQAGVDTRYHAAQELIQRRNQHIEPITSGRISE